MLLRISGDVNFLIASSTCQHQERTAFAVNNRQALSSFVSLNIKILSIGFPFFFLNIIFRVSEKMIFPWEREMNLLKFFLIHRFKYCSQEGDAPLELLSSHNSVDFGKENR